MKSLIQEEHLASLIRGSLSLMCKTSLNYETEVEIKGLLGITVDKKDVFLVDISEFVNIEPKEDSLSTQSSTSTSRLRSTLKRKVTDNSHPETNKKSKRTDETAIRESQKDAEFDSDTQSPSPAPPHGPLSLVVSELPGEPSVVVKIERDSDGEEMEDEGTERDEHCDGGNSPKTEKKTCFIKMESTGNGDNFVEPCTEKEPCFNIHEVQGGVSSPIEDKLCYKKLEIPTDAKEDGDSLQIEKEAHCSEDEMLPSGTAEFQMKVLHFLEDIRDTITTVQDCATPLQLESFEIQKADTVSDFMRMEEKLEKDHEFRNNVINYLKRVGGHGARDNVKRIMSRLMTNLCMSHLNMNGSGGKVAFELTRICSIIKSSVQNTFGGTEADILQHISRFLKYAPDRKGGTGRKGTEKNSRV